MEVLSIGLKRLVMRNTRPERLRLWNRPAAVQLIVAAGVIYVGITGGVMAQQRIRISSGWGDVAADLADNEAARPLVRQLPLTIPMRNPWEVKLANDIVSELERYSGEKRSTIEEMRRFLAVKGYRDLLSRLQAACENKRSFEALRAAAHAMRLYALERPAMSAATFRTPTTDTAEWRAAMDELRVFMTGILSDCGLRGNAADEALRILRSLVRGFVVHEVMDSFCDPVSYDECYDHAIEMFITGLPMLAGMNLKVVQGERGRSPEYLGATDRIGLAS